MASQVRLPTLSVLDDRPTRFILPYVTPARANTVSQKRIICPAAVRPNHLLGSGAKSGLMVQGSCTCGRHQQVE